MSYLATIWAAVTAALIVWSLTDWFYALVTLGLGGGVLLLKATLEAIFAKE